MKVIHLSTFDIRGGAARAAYRLHTGLHRLGHDSVMFVERRSSDDPTVMAFTPPMDLPSRLRRCLRRKWISWGFARYRTSRPTGYGLFSDDRSQYGATLLSQLPSCDVINLHWIAGFVDYWSLFGQIARHTPIVWTLHDMNPFTGGCHCDYGCHRFTDRCGACPQLGSKDPSDLSRKIWQRKRKIFAQIEPGRLHIVTPSRWLSEEARQSTLLGGFPISVIPNSLDTDVFRPRDRSIARAALGVSQAQDAKVVLFAADSVDDRHKGFALLAQILAGLDELSDLLLLSVGHGKPTLEAQISHLHLGYIDNDHLLSLIYSAADLFVVPSLQDNLPNTVLESLACGTPVVGFAVGGIPDLVEDGRTGLLVRPGDVSGLADALKELLEDPQRARVLGQAASEVARRQFGSEQQAGSYLELYEELVALQRGQYG